MFTKIRNRSMTFVFILAGFSMINSSSVQKSAKDDWTVLFDGSNLENWDTYLGPKQISGVSQDLSRQHVPGLNHDTANVFSLVNLDGEEVLRISGEIWGGLITKREFRNYHLQLQFKWGQLKWYPRGKDSDKRDSGVLYHSVGEHGDGDLYWLRSQEFQIEEGDCGDYWGVAGAMEDVKATLNADSVYQYDPAGTLFTFREDNEIGRHCKKNPDAEKPTGEWNTIDLYCYEGTSMHVVNGVLTMLLQNSKQLVNNKEIPLTQGKIQIQSESSEIFYRNIRIREINSLPEIN